MDESGRGALEIEAKRDALVGARVCEIAPGQAVTAQSTLLRC
jgi:hypothetical protein